MQQYIIKIGSAGPNEQRIVIECDSPGQYDNPVPVVIERVGNGDILGLDFSDERITLGGWPSAGRYGADDAEWQEVTSVDAFGDFDL